MGRLSPPALIAAVVVCSCGTAPASKLAKAPEFNPEGQTQCRVKKSQEKPLIVEWPSADRAELEALAKTGTVVVSYYGCEMRLLPRCKAPGKYVYVPVTPKADTVTIKNDDELYANIPIYAAKFEAKLAQTGQLNVAMTMVGRYTTDQGEVRQEQLTGACHGATHIISGLTVGAFEFFAGADAEVGAGVDIMGVGAGAKSAAKREMLTRDGSADACAKASEADARAPQGCGALIRVEVVPLEGVSLATGTGGTAETIPRRAPGHPPPTPLSAPSVLPTGSCPAGMAPIPSGSLRMKERRDPVTVSAFCLDITEVTVRAYAACAKSGACNSETVGTRFGIPYALEPGQRGKGQDKGKGACNWGISGRENHSMNCVDWGQATAYCRAQGKRLPTEDEWEWAARGGDEARAYPWGNAQPGSQLCWSGISKRASTCAVGSFPDANGRWGLEDMAGNVWEWTATTHRAEDGLNVRCRGGSWSVSIAAGLMAEGSAASGRVSYSPMERDDDLGFRCAL